MSIRTGYSHTSDYNGYELIQFWCPACTLYRNTNRRTVYFAMEGYKHFNFHLKSQKTMQRIQETNLGAAIKTKVILTVPKSDCSIKNNIVADSSILQQTKNYVN